MPVRIQKERKRLDKDEPETLPNDEAKQNRDSQKLKDDLAELLEEIDEILSTQEEDFAMKFRQAGGQ